MKSQHEEALQQLVDQVHGQVEELMTGYREIDILWYDIPVTEEHP